MPDIIRLVAALRNDRRGVTAIEYGIMGSLIAVAIIASVTALSGKLILTFGKIAAQLG